uniref:Membrane transporter protein n=1 Tax=viral metagenome TaxID=1070528 RepID=A0A6C0EZ32_9ZZZZ
MNNSLKIVISFVIGLIGGIINVYTGNGVALMIPLVMFTYIIEDFRTAVGSMFLAVFAPVSIIPTYNYHKSGNIDVMVGLFIGIGYFIGGYVTSTYYMNSFDKEVLYLFFGIYSLAVGYIFVKKSKLIF